MLLKINKSIVLKSTMTNILLFAVLFIFIGISMYQTFSTIVFEGAELVLEDHGNVLREFIENGEHERIQDYAETTAVSITVTPDSSTYTSPETSIDGVEIVYRLTISDGQKSYDVVITKSLSTEWKAVRTMLIWLIVMFIGIGLLIIFITAITTKRMIKPVYEMISTINTGQLDVRLDTANSQNEFKILAATFNELLDKIWDTYKQQDRFVSDASHELKTPLLVIQGYADLLERWGQEDEAVQMEAIESIKKETIYMNKLVERLLFLARADKNRQKLEHKEFELSALLDGIVKDSMLIDSTHNYQIEAEQITVKADISSIKQLMRILLDNSAKYSPADTKIIVRAYKKDKNAIIEVEDYGIGISKDDMPYIFDRFYKADKSRNRSHGSTGLGLSIAKWIVEENQGRIFATSKQVGTIMTVSLPLREDR